MCEYAGCNEQPEWEMQPVIKSKRSWLVCEKCAPQWVKDLSPGPFFWVRELCNPAVWIPPDLSKKLVGMK